MKKIYGFGSLAILLVALFSFNLALAEEGNATVVVSADVNSSINEQVPSNFRQGWEKFKINFIRNETIKAERELELARWKIAEAKFAAKNGDLDKAEKAMEKYDSLLLKIQERIEKLESKNITHRLDQAILVHEERLANLNLVLESANLTDEQRAKIEIRISKIENNTAHLEEVRIKIEEKRQEMILRLENKSDRIEQRIEERDGKLKFREKIKYANGSEVETELEIEDESDSDFDEDSEEDDSDDDTSINISARVNL